MITELIYFATDYRVLQSYFVTLFAYYIEYDVNIWAYGL